MMTSDILNIKSIFSESDELNSIDVIDDFQRTQSPADQLLRIVEQDQLQVFSTDDQDTFVISLNGDLNPQHLHRLLSDGVLSIHIDHEEECDRPSSHDDLLLCGDSLSELLMLEWEAAPDGVLSPLQDVDPSSPPPPLPDKAVTVDYKFVCKECGRGFNRRENFTSHKGKHDLELRRHHCTLCGERYSWRSSLNKHMEAKHSARKSCALCYKLFSTLGQVQEHIRRVHMKERKLQCPYLGCDKAFFNKYGLTLHIRSHSGLRPHLCGVCGQGFTNSSHKARHEANHHVAKLKHLAYNT